MIWTLIALVAATTFAIKAFGSNPHLLTRRETGWSWLVIADYDAGASNLVDR